MKPYKVLGVPKWALDVKSKSPGTSGGQHANRNYTAVELHLDVRCFENIEPAMLERLPEVAGSRLSKERMLKVEEKGERYKKMNLRVALERLSGILEEARKIPKKRIATKPTRASKVRRREAKQRQSRKKEERRCDYY